MNPAEPSADAAPPLPDDPATAAALSRYWRANIIIMSVLLCIWAVVGLGCGILFADKLNAYVLPGTGYPLGFWFAQQGSIIVFVLLILIYCILLNRLDNKHLAEMDRLTKQRASAAPSADAGGDA